MAEPETTFLPPPGQAEVVAALRAGDEAAFTALVDEYGASMLHVARIDSRRDEGHWASPPTRWSDLPESRLLGKESLEIVQATIDTLPDNQRAVITMRDVDGWSSEEVRNVLDLSESNQRVLLHRARSKVRRALEAYLEGDRS